MYSLLFIHCICSNGPCFLTKCLCLLSDCLCLSSCLCDEFSDSYELSLVSCDLFVIHLKNLYPSSTFLSNCFCILQITFLLWLFLYVFSTFLFVTYSKMVQVSFTLSSLIVLCLFYKFSFFHFRLHVSYLTCSSILIDLFTFTYPTSNLNCLELQPYGSKIQDGRSWCPRSPTTVPQPLKRVSPLKNSSSSKVVPTYPQCIESNMDSDQIHNQQSTFPSLSKLFHYIISGISLMFQWILIVFKSMADRADYGFNVCKLLINGGPNHQSLMVHNLTWII